MKKFRSGFVNIIGYPNVGKSTLLNRIIGEKISIVTPKPQTTRQRLFGILNGKNYQVVFSDNPGILDPKYELQKSMLASVQEALEDADAFLYMVEPTDETEKHAVFINKIKKQNTPLFLVINKIDLSDQNKLETVFEKWQSVIPADRIFPVSAKHNFNIDNLLKEIIAVLPEGMPYYPDDMITDRSERFLASEIVREKIFLHYREEIPYSIEVIVPVFDETDELIKIHAEIIVNRKSQKPILIGSGGNDLKEIGTQARKDMEEFFKKKVYLELFVKIRENWRDKKLFMRQFGYRA